MEFNIISVIILMIIAPFAILIFFFVPILSAISGAKWRTITAIIITQSIAIWGWITWSDIEKFPDHYWEEDFNEPIEDGLNIQRGFSFSGEVSSGHFYIFEGDEKVVREFAVRHRFNSVSTEDSSRALEPRKLRAWPKGPFDEPCAQPIWFEAPQFFPQNSHVWMRYCPASQVADLVVGQVS